MIYTKKRYDAKHKPLLLRLGDIVFLNLYKGYAVLENKGRKFSIQRCSPFRVKKVVGRLVYKLELPV